MGPARHAVTTGAARRAPTPTGSSDANSQNQSGAPDRGPFFKDLHQTPPALRVAVVLMCVGVALVGGGVVAPGLAVTTAVVLFIVGVALGVVGARPGPPPHEHEQRRRTVVAPAAVASPLLPPSRANPDFDGTSRSAVPDSCSEAW